MFLTADTGDNEVTQIFHMEVKKKKKVQLYGALSIIKYFYVKVLKYLCAGKLRYWLQRPYSYLEKQCTNARIW